MDIYINRESVKLKAMYLETTADDLVGIATKKRAQILASLERQGQGSSTANSINTDSNNR